MCKECYQNPCSYNCPNYKGEDVELKISCDWCEEDIYLYEKYYNIDGYNICENCINEQKRILSMWDCV